MAEVHQQSCMFLKSEKTIDNKKTIILLQYRLIQMFWKYTSSLHVETFVCFFIFSKQAF